MSTRPFPSTRLAQPRFAALAVFLLCVGRLAAQAVPPGAAAPVVTKKEDELVVLSPFMVTNDDKGYQASNTLSGTRLNSKLEDLGSSITVITKQQMDDMALLDINDVFRYEASTEGTDNFTTFNRNRSGGVNDQVQSDPQLSNRIRGMTRAGQSAGGANTAWGSFTSNANIPFDPYNIAAVEVSRGPNSNLFGLGSASGTVSVVPSQANLTKRSFGTDLRFDSYGGHRESMNFNQPLLPDKLALRVAAVQEAKGFIRKPSSERIHREFATILARPFKNTTIRASAERYVNDNRRPNTITPRDTTTEWKAGGSPTWDPTTQMVTFSDGRKAGPFTSDTAPAITIAPGVTTAPSALPLGLIGGYNGWYAHPTVYVDGGQIQSFQVMRSNNAITTGNPSNPFTTANGSARYLQSATQVMRNFSLLGATSMPLYIVNGTTDKSIYDWTKYNIVAPNHASDRATTYSAEVEQIVVNSPTHLVAAKVGAFQQKFSRFNANFIDNLETVIYVDVNEKLLNGSPNPYFKRPFVEATAPSDTFRTINSSIYSADLAYQLTPSRQLPKWLSWIGRQRFGGHAEQNLTDTVNATYVERVSSNNVFIDPTNRVGSQNPAQRFYVGDATGQNVDYGAAALNDVSGTYPLTWFNNRTSTWTTEPVTMDLLASSGSGARQRNEVRTLNFTAQSYFFNDRLVLTGGFRRDRQRQRTGAGSFVNAATGLSDFSNTNVFGPAVNFRPAAAGSPLINLPGWSDQSGDTKTWGSVVKVTSWLNFHFNKSDSFAPDVVRQAVDSIGNVPNPHGYATEWGVSVTALDGKLNVRVNHYQTKELHSRGSEVGTLGNRYLDMEGRPDGSNNIQQGSFRYFCQQIALARFAAAGNRSPAQTDLDQAVAKLMGVSLDWYNRLVYSGPSQPQTVGTTDVSSQGFELEATYNPTRNWRMKFTGSQTRARDDQVSPDIYNWWLQRVPIWENTRADSVPGNGDGKGPNWWNNIPAGQRSDTPQTRWLNEQWAAYWAASTNAGRPRTQIREFHVAAISNYDFTEGRLKNFTFGGALRWESRASIGFLAAPPETSGVYQGAVLFLDTNKPVWDKARYYVDLSSAYRFKLFSGKVRGKVQLNAQNVFENGHLQTIGVNPDGKGYAFRIIDPRKFILSTSFDL